MKVGSLVRYKVRRQDEVSEGIGIVLNIYAMGRGREPWDYIEVAWSGNVKRSIRNISRNRLEVINESR